MNLMNLKSAAPPRALPTMIVRASLEAPPMTRQFSQQPMDLYRAPLARRYSHR
jgi:hypothetical protein